MNERDFHRMNDAQEVGELCLANLHAILDCWGVENVERLDRAIYKFTPCGPHLSVETHDGRWWHSGNLEGIENGNDGLLEAMDHVTRWAERRFRVPS